MEKLEKTDAKSNGFVGDYRFVAFFVRAVIGAVFLLPEIMETEKPEEIRKKGYCIWKIIKK